MSHVGIDTKAINDDTIARERVSAEAFSASFNFPSPTAWKIRTISPPVNIIEAAFITKNRYDTMPVAAIAIVESLETVIKLIRLIKESAKVPIAVMYANLDRSMIITIGVFLLMK